MIKDDLRHLVEIDLPALAHDIAADALSKCDWQPAQFHSGNCDYERGMFYAGPCDVGGSPGYRYSPFNHDGSVRDAAQIIFYSLRVTGIGETEVGPLEVMNPDESPELVTVDTYVNDGPTVHSRETSTEKEQGKEDGGGTSETTSKEFRARIQQSANAGIKLDIVDIGTSGEFEQELTRRVERVASHEWRRSDRITDAVRKNYDIWPYMDWSLTTEHSVKDIRQETVSHGLLDCKIRIDVRDWSSADWDSLRDLFDTFRGLKTGYNRFGQWWSSRTSLNGGPPAIPDGVIDAWHVPTLRLTNVLSGRRGRYTRGNSIQHPIESKKQLALDYMAAQGFDLEKLQEVYIDGKSATESSA